MRHHIHPLSLVLVMLALAGCGGPFASGAGAPTPTAALAVSPTPSPPPSPTPTPPAGFSFYMSSAQTYQIAYPSGWTILDNKTQIEFTGVGQLFEVTTTPATAGANPAQIDNTYCQSLQKGVAPDPVATITVRLAGQSWTRANCDAGAEAPAIELVVEVVIYKGTLYQLDYTSPIVEFGRDNAQYYAPMERSFRFLH